MVVDMSQAVPRIALLFSLLLHHHRKLSPSLSGVSFIHLPMYLPYIERGVSKHKVKGHKGEIFSAADKQDSVRLTSLLAKCFHVEALFAEGREGRRPETGDRSAKRGKRGVSPPPTSHLGHSLALTLHNSIVLPFSPSIQLQLSFVLL